jgi:hypothetical protein
VLPKTKWNRAELCGTRFITIWRSEINTGLKADAQVGLGFFHVQYIMYVKESEGNMLGSAHESTTYAI